VKELQNCLDKCWRNFAQQARQRLRALSEKTLARELRQRLREAQQQLDVARQALGQQVERFRSNVGRRLAQAQLSLRAHNPAREVAARRQQVAETRHRLEESSRHQLAKARERWKHHADLLRVLGPEATLERGYSITRDAAGRVIRQVAEAKTRTRIKTRVRDGEFESEIL
jgi:exodeoxyribonuclease VII large subunit